MVGNFTLRVPSFDAVVQFSLCLTMSKCDCPLYYKYCSVSHPKVLSNIHSFALSTTKYILGYSSFTYIFKTILIHFKMISAGIVLFAALAGSAAAAPHGYQAGPQGLQGVRPHFPYAPRPFYPGRPGLRPVFPAPAPFPGAGFPRPNPGYPANFPVATLSPQQGGENANIVFPGAEAQLSDNNNANDNDNDNVAAAKSINENENANLARGGHGYAHGGEGFGLGAAESENRNVLANENNIEVANANKNELNVDVANYNKNDNDNDSLAKALAFNEDENYNSAEATAEAAAENLNDNENANENAAVSDNDNYNRVASELDNRIEGSGSQSPQYEEYYY